MSDLSDRLRALASEAAELADQVEQLEQDAAAGVEASSTLASLRAALGMAAPPRVTTSPATSRPRRPAAASSDAGIFPKPMAPPTHCASPSCGRKLVQSTTGRKRHFCDNKCAARARKARDAGGDAADDEGSPVSPVEHGDRRNGAVVAGGFDAAAAPARPERAAPRGQEVRSPRRHGAQRDAATAVSDLVHETPARAPLTATARSETPPLLASPVLFDVETDRREEQLALSELALERRTRVSWQDAQREMSEDRRAGLSAAAAARRAAILDRAAARGGVG